MKKESIDAARDGVEREARNEPTSSDVERMRDALEKIEAMSFHSPMGKIARDALLSLSRERDSPALRTGLCNSSFANPEAPPTRPAMEPPCPECGQPYVPTKQRDRFVRRPSTSNADEWQLWLQDGLTYEPASGCAFLAVQIVEAIEEHQRALAREVYGLAEDAAERFSDLASEDTPEGHYSRGAIAEAKSIARAINAIMPYSCDPSSLKDGT
jgi:hypothetical protein